MILVGSGWFFVVLGCFLLFLMVFIVPYVFVDACWFLFFCVFYLFLVVLGGSWWGIDGSWGFLVVLGGFFWGC